MPTDGQYRQLLAFRTTLRRFDQWSREAAAEHGLTHAQHQLLLAVRGSATPGGPPIGEVAEALLVRPHTAGELVDRMAHAGFVERVQDETDHRKVRLRLTAEGERVLRELTAVHLAELKRLRPLLGKL
ncbi:MAG TPA: MarR family transcriptional regulator [Nocardioides sp.]|uniref:MarR family winged helix-turn-helix transcriptional regulator n=1 Tax=Nocardioides sp. TaxID=35761 RepID=UPI002F413B20